ncbi:hypothetical protein H8958_018558 [Nasalis larvatus]
MQEHTSPASLSPVKISPNSRELPCSPKEPLRSEAQVTLTTARLSAKPLGHPAQVCHPDTASTKALPETRSQDAQVQPTHTQRLHAALTEGGIACNLHTPISFWNGKERELHFRTAETRRQAGRRSHPLRARPSTRSRGGDSLHPAPCLFLTLGVSCPRGEQPVSPSPTSTPPRDSLSPDFAFHQEEEQPLLQSNFRATGGRKKEENSEPNSPLMNTLGFGAGDDPPSRSTRGVFPLFSQ